MPSPVPKHLRTPDETRQIPAHLRDHQTGLIVTPKGSSRGVEHPAKYASGLPTALLALAGTDDVGDPMAGSGRIAAETGVLRIALNEIDPRYMPLLHPLEARGHVVTWGDAAVCPWQRQVLIFSPPYYPRTDRRVEAAHPADRGAVVGFRTGYGTVTEPGFVGNPGGVNAILAYRDAMRRIYHGLRGTAARRMILVTKNWTRLGVELRLDQDTILTAAEAGWVPVARTGWEPPASLWARYNTRRGTGVRVEDVLIFDASTPPTRSSIGPSSSKRSRIHPCP